MGAKEEYKAQNAERDTRRAEKQNSKWWFRQPIPIDRFTGWLVAWTALLFAATIANVVILNLTDDKIGQQLTVMKGQLDLLSLDQRPWLALDVSTKGPLSHDRKGWDYGLSWYLPLDYRIKNVGKTPAIDVAFFAHIVPVATGVGRIFLQDELERACVFWERMQQIGIGNSELIFPQEEWPEKQFEVHGPENTFEAAKKADGQTLKYLGQFLVTACVVYKPTFEVDVPFRTAKEYYVGDKSRGAIDLDGRGISSDNLSFGPNPTRGSMAR
jgi:hypothetical protein